MDKISEIRVEFRMHFKAHKLCFLKTFEIAVQKISMVSLQKCRIIVKNKNKHLS